MRIGRLIATAGILAGGMTAMAPAALADVTSPIGPNQMFHGLVNGVHDKAQITVVCPGPAFPGQTGHPVSGQTIAVAPGASSSSTGGYTGSAAISIIAGFLASATTNMFSFTYYNAPQPIPTSISVPCSGTETIRFTPEPTSSTARPDDVVVTFVNIAV